MNPETNKFEELRAALGEGDKKLFRPDGSEVPKAWVILKLGELVVIKGYTFRVGYIGESTLLLEPVSPADPIDSAG